MKLALLIALTMSASGNAQGPTASSGSLPPIFSAAVRDIAPAERPGAWVIQVISRGGFAARTSHDLVVTSEGTRSFSEPADSKSLSQDVLRPLTERVAATDASRWTPSRLSTCADCDATLVVLARRDASGAVQTLTAFWDVTTKRSVPAEVMRIYEEALKLK